jgi:hypothetical protein
MNININEVNNILKSKRPATKTPTATEKTPDAATLRSRIAEAGKALNQLLAQPQVLGASKIAEQVQALSAKLCQLERQLASARGLSSRLVRLIKSFPNGIDYPEPSGHSCLSDN